MGRGNSNPQEILYGEHVSTRQAETVITLTDKQETGVRSLALLKTEHPEAPGFNSSDIANAANRLPARHPFAGLGVSTAGGVVSSLVRKGLVEKTDSSLCSFTWGVNSEQPGWRLTEKGFQEAKLLGLDTPRIPPREPILPQRS